VAAARSPAVTTHAAGPMTDPWTILAVMLRNDDHWSLNTALWEWPWKKSVNQLIIHMVGKMQLCEFLQ